MHDKLDVDAVFDATPVMMSSVCPEKNTLLVLAPVKDEEPSKLNQMNDATAFHRYMDLPFEIRQQIRAESIDQHRHMENKENENIAQLASVSKEWSKDVEKILFADIRVDLRKDEGLLKFREVLTHERRRLLKSLDIIIDDSQTGPWYKRMGLLDISRAMEKTGHLFQLINSWEDRQSIEISFSSSSCPDFDSASACDPSMETTSLWMSKELSRATNSGQIPTNMVLWAINSEFPSSLRMVTDLTFPPDCLPLPATLAILRRMPNLTSCKFELAFKRKFEVGWGNFTDLINELPALVPSLHDLNIQNPRIHDHIREALIFNPKRLSTAIRDYSQSLKYLRVSDFAMHQVFFQPFSDETRINMEVPQLRWPKLEVLSLNFATYAPYVGPGTLGLTAAALLCAAGRAAEAMPVLRIFQAKVLEDPVGFPYKFLQVKQERSESSGSSGGYSVQISGLSEDDDRRILNAWTPFLGVEARFVKEESRLDPQIRRFYTTCSDGQK